ncbi:argininosuccinate lyase [uncultured Desulfatiglans sp.]|uniref:Argininosuccinate lyase n=1 Tax=Uncultured Desulfatiglans sp. TaxID=1748965 RepID=A0A653AHQ2_UNCDX|nr:argininosuccinate lyase [uncultured Desulfatiglans sp.]
MVRKTWGGRFKEETDALVNRFNASIGFDRRLYAQDILGSIAHARMLARQEIIQEEEAERMVEALGEIKRGIERGEIPFSDDFEDIHTLVEKNLIERIGALGEKLHTGRSRNDQVALDIRLYVRDVIQETIALIGRVQESLIELGEKNVDLIMPGYTHLQRAQPVLVAHHLLAYVEMLGRDRARLTEGLRRVNVLPLGSAALAGSTFPLDREGVARELGFDGVSRNSMDAVSDRDFILEFLFAASTVMMHLSRLSEELIIWSSQEFGFITISDGFCTGSSIMPQKKNPDVPELIRGKTGRVYGDLMGLLTTMKGLPLTYNKDMQEDKEGLFDAAETLTLCLEIMARLLREVTFNAGRLKAAAAEGYLVATDLADYLVGKGVTFREAHGVVGKMVLHAMERGLELHELPLEEMKTFSRVIDEQVYGWLSAEACVARRKLTGGTAPGRVREALSAARKEWVS